LFQQRCDDCQAHSYKLCGELYKFSGGHKNYDAGVTIMTHMAIFSVNW